MEEKYPMAKVIILYGIYGSFMGTFLGSLIATVLTLGFALLAIPVMFIGGMMIAFLPAITTGIILALHKETLNNKDKSSWIFSAGFSVTAIYAFIYCMYKHFTSQHPSLLIVDIFIAILGGMALGMLGGVTSVFTAKFVLPNN